MRARIGLLLHARMWQDDGTFIDSGGRSITAETLIPSCEVGSRWINTGFDREAFPHNGGSRQGISEAWRLEIKVGQSSTQLEL